MTDASSVVLSQNGNAVDAVCFYFDTTTQTDLSGTGFICNGTPVSNLPHNNTSGSGSSVDVSIERAPGGTAGNCTDTGDNAADFISQTPATPQDVASAPTP